MPLIRHAASTAQWSHTPPAPQRGSEPDLEASSINAESAGVVPALAAKELAPSSLEELHTCKRAGFAGD